MAKRRVLLVAGLAAGGYLGWRAAGERLDRGDRAPRRPLGTLLTLEKAKALGRLGRERALDAIDHALGGRPDRAA